MTKRGGAQLGLLVVASLLATTASTAQIEKNAVINDKLQGNASALEAMIAMVRAHGYRCDSISAARPMVFSRGFVLTCNGFAYEYEIVDKGGNWQVTVK